MVRALYNSLYTLTLLKECNSKYGGHRGNHRYGRGSAEELRDRNHKRRKFHCG